MNRSLILALVVWISALASCSNQPPAKGDEGAAVEPDVPMTLLAAPACPAGTAVVGTSSLTCHYQPDGSRYDGLQCYCIFNARDKPTSCPAGSTRLEGATSCPEKEVGVSILHELEPGDDPKQKCQEWCDLHGYDTFGDRVNAADVRRPGPEPRRSPCCGQPAPQIDLCAPRGEILCGTTSNWWCCPQRSPVCGERNNCFDSAKTKTECSSGQTRSVSATCDFSP